MIYDDLAAVLGDPLVEHFGDEYWDRVEKADASANYKVPAARCSASVDATMATWHGSNQPGISTGAAPSP
jgi:hypothetical protein